MLAIPPWPEPEPEESVASSAVADGPATFVVRYGQMRLLGEFAGLVGREHPRGQAVVVRTERGIELGEVLCPAGDREPRLPTRR